MGKISVRFIVLLLSFWCGIFVGYIRNSHLYLQHLSSPRPDPSHPKIETEKDGKIEEPNVSENSLNVVKEEIQNIKKDVLTIETSLPNYNVHIFYYPWYGNPEIDGKWIHWNHEYIPHWDKMIARRYASGRHNPNKDDIGANFYPSLGLYSSRDPKIVREHMKMLRAAKVGTIAISWYPPGLADPNGIPSDSIVPTLLDIANEYQIKLCFHLEPYPNRNPDSLKRDIMYIIDNYGNHPALFKYRRSSVFRSYQELPFFYAYDSYLMALSDWHSILHPTGKNTIRGTKYDGFFTFLMVEPQHKDYINAGFDAFYTYFASQELTYGSSPRNWKVFANLAKSTNTEFIPSVGPGYIDTEVRPWNDQNTKNRRNGEYYTNFFQRALEVRPNIISITSFNEWHEGTQIEPCIPMQSSSRSSEYLDYLPNEPDFYLQKTRELVDQFSNLK